MEIINRILVFLLITAIIAPIIIIPIILFYNSRVNRRRFKMEFDPCDKTVKNFIRVLRRGPLTKYEKKWEVFTETFNIISKNKNIDYKLKKELYDVLVERGCKEKDLKLKKEK